MFNNFWAVLFQENFFTCSIPYFTSERYLDHFLCRIACLFIRTRAFPIWLSLVVPNNNISVEQIERTSRVKELSGVIKLPSDYDYKKDYADCLGKKYQWRIYLAFASGISITTPRNIKDFKDEKAKVVAHEVKCKDTVFHLGIILYICQPMTI